MSSTVPDMERMDELLIAAADEMEQNRAALKVARDAILQFDHAQQSGPSWFTRGESAMYQHVHLWLRRGLKATQEALGPYDDNDEYLKEKSVAELSAPRQRYYAPGDLLEVPADAEIDELGRYDRCKTVYLASDVDKQP